MNSQLSFNSTEEYTVLEKVGKCVGILCGKPVYRKFDIRDVRPIANYPIGSFTKLVKALS